MNWLEALILGIVQGFTEFLPVSSSGHLELGKAILNTGIKDDLSFSVAVHGATVLSIIVVFYKDLKNLIIRSITLKWNSSTRYLAMLILSMIPVAIVGLLLKDQIEKLFTGNVIFVGSMLIITAIMLILTNFANNREKEISFTTSLIIGIAQAVAVIPGISRSGATISTALLLGINRSEAAKFSFLMVLLPIIAANFFDLITGEFTAAQSVGTVPILIGFAAAFISGLIACKWMLSIVRKGKLIYFGVYCLAIGIIAILTGI